MTLTAKPTHRWRQIGPNTLVYEPICTCFDDTKDTSGEIWCPLHGKLHKLADGTIIRKQS